MTKRLPIHASHSEEIIAYARVDDDDYAHLAAYRWVMQGTPEAPGSIYRARCVWERASQDHPALVLSQEIVPHSGHVTFHNGDRLDYRKANLVTSYDRQQRLEHGAEVLRRMNRLHAPEPASDSSVTLPLTQGWTAWIDAEWEDDVRRYSWYMARRGPHVYAQRQRKQGRSRTIIALARVIAGLQDIDSGERLRPGVVAYQTPADVHRQLLDLRRTNLVITTRGGVTLRRPHPQRYRGVHAVGRTGRYRATLSLGGHYRVLDLYDTPRKRRRHGMRPSSSWGCKTSPGSITSNESFFYLNRVFTINMDDPIRESKNSQIKLASGSDRSPANGFARMLGADDDVGL